MKLKITPTRDKVLGGRYATVVGVVGDVDGGDVVANASVSLNPCVCIVHPDSELNFVDLVLIEEVSEVGCLNDVSQLVADADAELIEIWRCREVAGKGGKGDPSWLGACLRASSRHGADACRVQGDIKGGSSESSQDAVASCHCSGELGRDSNVGFSSDSDHSFSILSIRARVFSGAASAALVHCI